MKIAHAFLLCYVLLFCFVFSWRTPALLAALVSFAAVITGSSEERYVTTLIAGSETSAALLVRVLRSSAKQQRGMTEF